jgi:hypothetical protein
LAGWPVWDKAGTVILMFIPKKATNRILLRIILDNITHS